MKAIHTKPEVNNLPLHQWLAETYKLESEDTEEAIKEYKRIVQVYPTQEKAFDRLMILFRKIDKSKDELYWINKAIENFDHHYKKSMPRHNSYIEKLSKTISKSTGLSDTKGNPIHVGMPIDRWQKRKKLVQKKLNK
jgi:tetratricopeptide (TPR) repeat protein